MIKTKIKKQIKELERVNNKIEYIIDHKNRYLLDRVILDHIISKRSRIEMAIETSKFVLNNSDLQLLESIYNTNNSLDIVVLELQLDTYIDLLGINVR